VSRTARKIESSAIREPGVFTVTALMRALELPLDTLESVLHAESTANDEGSRAEET
jgi:hypothetical protein